MKASVLIKQLQEWSDEYGDREVVFANYDNFPGFLNEYTYIQSISREETSDDFQPVLVLWDE